MCPTTAARQMYLKQFYFNDLLPKYSTSGLRYAKIVLSCAPFPAFCLVVTWGEFCYTCQSYQNYKQSSIWAIQILNIGSSFTITFSSFPTWNNLISSKDYYRFFHFSIFFEQNIILNFRQNFIIKYFVQDVAYLHWVYSTSSGNVDKSLSIRMVCQFLHTVHEALAGSICHAVLLWTVLFSTSCQYYIVKFFHSHCRSGILFCAPFFNYFICSVTKILVAHANGSTFFLQECLPLPNLRLLLSRGSFSARTVLSKLGIIRLNIILPSYCSWKLKGIQKELGPHRCKGRRWSSWYFTGGGAQLFSCPRSKLLYCSLEHRRLCG